MSLAIATAPVTLAGAWLQSRYPGFAATLARSGRAALDELARQPGRRRWRYARSAAVADGLHGATAAGSPAPRRATAPARAVTALAATGSAGLHPRLHGVPSRGSRGAAVHRDIDRRGLTIVATGLAAPFGAEIATLAYTLAVIVIAMPIVVMGFRGERAKRIGPSTP